MSPRGPSVDAGYDARRNPKTFRSFGLRTVAFAVLDGAGDVRRDCRSACSVADRIDGVLRVGARFEVVRIAAILVTALVSHDLVASQCAA